MNSRIVILTIVITVLSHPHKPLCIICPIPFLKPYCNVSSKAEHLQVGRSSFENAADRYTDSGKAEARDESSNWGSEILKKLGVALEVG
jgi:hypothetical protein